MRQIFTADCETDPFKVGRFPRPFIWGLYSDGFYKEFYSTDEFIEYIKDVDGIIYAHNGGKFDWHFVLHAIEQFTPCSVINGRLSKFKIGKAELRDSYNLLPVPLSAYKKDDFDYSLLEEKVRHKHMPKIREYLKNDCVYLYELVMRFIGDYGLNLTLASSAIKAWEKISEEKAPKTKPEFYHRFKPFYYGGRVQVFESGIIERDFKVIDINSAYPNAMSSYHPYGDSFNLSSSLPTDKKDIERCFIKLKCKSLGALPSRDEKGGLSFPCDNIIREYFITGHEYLAGLDTKTISDITIIECYQFDEMISFKEYVQHFYHIKETTDKNTDAAGYLIAKLFLNSLYGKFASNPEEYKAYMFAGKSHVLAAEREGYDFVAELDSNILVARDLYDEEMRYYNVATAASITGAVRAKLWRAICQCKDVMYCDTDSIACVDTGDLELDPKRLGAWDVEAECDYAAISGKKLYAFRTKAGKWKTASKGARLTAAELVTLASGKAVKYANPAPTYSIKKKPIFIERTLVKNK